MKQRIGLLRYEAAVKAPSFRIASVMLIIAIAALNFGAIRAVSTPESTSLFLLCLVIQPMANILTGCLLLAILRPRSRPFLGGFGLFGVMAIALVVVGVMRVESLLLSYLNLSIAIERGLFGLAPPTGPNGLSFCILSLWALWPQLAFAVMGGFLFRKFRSTELAADRPPGAYPNFASPPPGDDPRSAPGE